MNRTLSSHKPASITWTEDKDSLLVTLWKLSPCLYDLSCQDSSDQSARQKAWDSIANTLQLPVREVVRRTTSLRAQYSRLTKLRNQSANGAAGDDPQRFPYLTPHQEWIYKHLAFLAPHIRRRTDYMSFGFGQQNEMENHHGDVVDLCDQDEAPYDMDFSGLSPKSQPSNCSAAPSMVSKRSQDSPPTGQPTPAKMLKESMDSLPSCSEAANEMRNGLSISMAPPARLYEHEEAIVANPMGRDPVIRDPMGRDSMGRDPMGRNSMGQDLVRDPMGRDSMDRDSMGRDHMGRDPMGRDSMGRDHMVTHTMVENPSDSSPEFNVLSKLALAVDSLSKKLDTQQTGSFSHMQAEQKPSLNHEVATSEHESSKHCIKDESSTPSKARAPKQTSSISATTAYESEDVFGTFGKFVVTELRLLTDPAINARAMNAINNALFEAKMAQLSSQSNASAQAEQDKGNVSNSDS